MYPAEIRIGGKKWPGNLSFKPATCKVFPRNYQHLAANPLERIDQAVAKNSPTHVPLAAALVKEGEREKAIEVYETVEEIESDPAVRKTLEDLQRGFEFLQFVGSDFGLRFAELFEAGIRVGGRLFLGAAGSRSEQREKEHADPNQ